MAATAFPAAAIISGTIAPARLGSGTADATSFLRGDSTWAVVPEVTRASLGLATTDSPTFAGATFSGAVTGVSGLTFRGHSSAGLFMDTDGSSYFNSVGNGIRLRYNGSNRMVVQSNGIYFDGTLSGATATEPLIVTHGIDQRNGTNGQKSRLYKTYTSATSGEWLELDAATDASNFDIAASIGSAGGTARGIRIGGKNAAGTFTSWLSFSTAGATTFSAFCDFNSTVFANGSNGLRITNRVYLQSATDGNLKLSNNGLNSFGLLQLGGTTSSFPAIKRNATAINFRLADDSADAPITASNATFNTGTITTSQPLSLTQTWNNAATTFTGLQVNATDTASNAASLLMDLQVGGVSKFKITKSGTIVFNNDANTTITYNPVGTILGNGEMIARVGNAVISKTAFALSSANNLGMPDVYLYPGFANTLAQRNGTNGQKSRLYKTYTSATSGEWLELDAATDASNFDIAASIGSAGGTARGIRIGGKDAAGTFTPWLSFSTAGVATFATGLAGSFTSLQITGNGIASDPFTTVLTTRTGTAALLRGLSGQGVASYNFFASERFVFKSSFLTTHFPSQTGDVSFARVSSTSAAVYTTATGTTPADWIAGAITASGTINGRASTTTASTAPIKLPTGVLMTTPEAGAIEYDGTNLYFTDSGGVRRQLAVV